MDIDLLKGEDFDSIIDFKTIEINLVHHLVSKHNKTVCGLPMHPDYENYIIEDAFIEEVTCGICKTKWMKKYEEVSRDWLATKG